MKHFRLLLILLILAVASAAQDAQQVTVPGLSAAVSVGRDARSIPYISAVNDDDLYFMQGYVTASDRLWQMDLMRRVARGEMSEIFGAQTLDEDRRWRKFGFVPIAHKSFDFMTPELKKALTSYAAGVNAYIESRTDKTLPAEFQILRYKPAKWTPIDTIVIGKILADALSSTYSQDIMRASIANIDHAKLNDLLDQRTPYDVILFGSDGAVKKNSAKAMNVHSISDSVAAAAAQDEIVRRNSLSRAGVFAEELAASNNWVISGKKTADGKPLLANDPHLRATAPGIWYLTHLSTPKMRVSGVTFPGVPGIVLGHNDHIAWGATNVGPDVQDLFIEKFDADGKYQTPDGTQEPKKRVEKIIVRTNPLMTETRTEELEVVETRNGPIVLEADGKRYALRWTAFDPKNLDFEAFFLVNRATNWNEFKAAFRNYGGATQNFVYADKQGHIGWHTAGKIPLRRTGDGALPYDGATRDGDWIGYIPFDEMPHLFDPPAGFIVTANQRIVGTDYKYPQMSRDAAMPWRARRLYDLISAGKKLTADDMQAFQFDAFNVPLRSLADQFVKLNAGSEASRKMFAAWDGMMTPDSKAALYLNDLRGCVADTIAAENRPIPSYVIRERIVEKAVREQAKLWLPKKYASYKDLLTDCDVQTQAAMVRKFGVDDSAWKWGNVMTSTLPHPLAAAPLIAGRFKTPAVPINGSSQSPNVGSSVSMRYIATPGNWDETRLGIPLGQSGDASSPHYTDQFEAWRTGKPQIFPFSEKAVKDAVKSTVVYRP